MSLGLDVDVGLTAEISGAFGFALGADVAAKLTGDLDLNAQAGLLMDMSTDFTGDIDPELRGELDYAPHIEQAMAAEFPNGRAEVPGELPELTEGLEYFEVLEVPAP